MQFRSLSEADWEVFLRWAAAENWRVSFQEQRLFHGLWRPYFFVLYTDGTVQGFVSAVVYKESGWIGNLLVDPKRRGRGYGAVLFDFALDFLRGAKVGRVWLTASAAGAPLYLRRKFVAIDRVDRWVANGLGECRAVRRVAAKDLVAIDQRCWGESRSTLINALVDDGEMISAGEALGVLQPGVSFWQLGPWLSVDRNPQQNNQLLTLAVAKTPAGKELFVDVLASSGMELVLRAAGFKKGGANQLMVLSADSVVLDGVLALASLGSIG